MRTSWLKAWIVFALMLGVRLSAYAQITPPGPRVETSNFAGLLYASNFGQWIVPQPNLGAYSWNNGKYCQTTGGGTIFASFTVGTPVTIIDEDTPAHDEIVTPSAVVNTPNNCAISVAPIYGHNHYHFTTATGGLQEALNWAGTNVYQVVLTPDWSFLGGTTLMITSAQGNAAVPIEDQRTACLTAYLWSGSAYVAQQNSCTGGGGLTLPLTVPLTWLPPSLGLTTLQNQLAPAAISGTAVTILTSNGGGSYTGTPGLTLSGGSCSTSPTLKDFNSSGAILFQIISFGNCTVPPTVTVGGDSTGSGASLTLGLEGANLETTVAGVPFLQLNTGFGQNVLQSNAFMTNPVIAGLTLAQGGNSIYSSISVANCGPMMNYTAGVDLISPCSMNDTIAFNPGASNSPMVRFEPRTIGSDTVVIYATNGDSSLAFNPYQLGTFLAQPMPAGFNWYLSNNGILAVGAYFGGAGYTSSGTCSLSGGVQLSGGTDTCSTSLSSGSIVLAVTTNGLWSTPPNYVISGSSGGTGAPLSGTMLISHVNTISDSFWVDATASHAFHWSPVAKGTTGSDWMTLTGSTFLVPSIKPGAVSCLHIDSTGNITPTSGDCATGGSGSVTSVALTLPSSVFSVGGSPITTSGTLAGAFVNQTANTVFAGPASGAAGTPSFRALTVADFPTTYPLINIQTNYPASANLGAKLFACLTDVTVLAGYTCDATGAVQADTGVGSAWAISGGNITITMQNNVPAGDQVHIVFATTTALTADYTITARTATTVTAATLSGLTSGSEVVNMYPLKNQPIEIGRSQQQIVKFPSGGVLYDQTPSTTMATPSAPNIVSTAGGAGNNFPASTNVCGTVNYRGGDGVSASSAEFCITSTASGIGFLTITGPASCPSYAQGYDVNLTLSSVGTLDETLQGNAACGTALTFKNAVLFPSQPAMPTAATGVPAFILWNINNPAMYAETGIARFTIRTGPSFGASNIIATGTKGISALNNISAYNYSHINMSGCSIFDSAFFAGSSRQGVGAVGTGGTTGNHACAYKIYGTANDVKFDSLGLNIQDTFGTGLVIQRTPSTYGDGEGMGRLEFDRLTVVGTTSTLPLVTIAGIPCGAATNVNCFGAANFLLTTPSFETQAATSCMTMTDVAGVTLKNPTCASTTFTGSNPAYIFTSTAGTAAQYQANTLDIENPATVGYPVIYNNGINGDTVTVPNNNFPYTGAYHYGGGKLPNDVWQGRPVLSDNSIQAATLALSGSTSGVKSYVVPGTTTTGTETDVTGLPGSPAVKQYSTSDIASWTLLQGTDTKILTSGTISGTGATLCTDALGGATTTGCSAGGSTAWSALTNPTTTLALTMGNSDTTLFTFGAATSTNNMMEWTDTASNTGTGALGLFHTATGSAAKPWQADAAGIGWQVTNAGALASVGSSASGSIVLGGSSSGSVTLTVQAVAGTPTVTFGTATGTPAVTAGSPLAINTTTGNITCATCTTAASALTSNALVLGGGLQAEQTVAGFTTDGTSVLTLGVAGTSVGSLALKNATSGTLTLSPATGALGTVTATLPANTGTLAELNLAQTFSAVQTISASNGLVLSAMTGTACLEEVSGVVTSTGSACGSGGGLTGATNQTGFFSATNTFTATSAITVLGTGTGAPVGFNQTAPINTLDLIGSVSWLGTGPGTYPTNTATFTTSSTTITVSSTTGLQNSGYGAWFNAQFAGDVISWTGLSGGNTLTGVVHGYCNVTGPATRNTGATLQPIQFLKTDALTSNFCKEIDFWNGGILHWPTANELANSTTFGVNAEIWQNTNTFNAQATFTAALFISGVDGQTGTTYAIVSGDENKLLTFSNAAAVAVTIPVATTTGFTNGAMFHVFNRGAGPATITPATSTINGQSTLVLNQGQGAMIISDGTNYSAWVSSAPGSTGTATYAVGTGVTSVVCATGYSCNNSRGTVTIGGGTATTGTIATVNFSIAQSAAPACFAKMNGGASGFQIGTSAPTTGAFNITAGLTVVGATFNVDYWCMP